MTNIVTDDLNAADRREGARELRGNGYGVTSSRYSTDFDFLELSCRKRFLESNGPSGPVHARPRFCTAVFAERLTMRPIICMNWVRSAGGASAANTDASCSTRSWRGLSWPGACRSGVSTSEIRRRSPPSDALRPMSLPAFQPLDELRHVRALHDQRIGKTPKRHAGIAFKHQQHGRGCRRQADLSYDAR